ncbi:MAG: tRNA pseudouridine(38-40) synthase TruA [Alphaproteobacteria bacterium]|nr:tRNA pseudouridine(38-40) synthase TruA [Alphaproteobacteria bacterium]
MTRFKLTIEYDGGPFSGWQRLAEGPSVQGALEAAVERLTGVRAEVTGAGRTDAGVHAWGQVAHVDIAKPLTADQVRDALNAHLRPDPIAVLAAEVVDPGFHARFDAVRRLYEYRILNRRADLALERGRAWRIAAPLNAPLMAEAADRFIGRHDFTTFRDSQCQAASPIKTLERCVVLRQGEEVRIECAAPSFLHRQVRSIVGTLAEVGLGKRTPEDVAAALAARDRARCGQVAPAEGLYLKAVRYA